MIIVNKQNFDKLTLSEQEFKKLVELTKEGK